MKAINLEIKREREREVRGTGGREPFLKQALSVSHWLWCAVQTVTDFTQQWASHNHPNYKQQAV